jgi:RimJ/RimL family protein N-acetyltransferase
MTGLALDALSAPDLRHLHVDVVIGAHTTHRGTVEAGAAARTNTEVHESRPHLADLMAAADLAVGAGGGTAWERMCLGLPSIVVSIAENQRPTCEALAADGLIEYLGSGVAAGSAEIGNAVRRLIADRARRSALSSRGRAVVDGLGVSRVSAVIAGRGGGRSPLDIRNRLLAANETPAGFGEFTFAWIHTCRSADVLSLRNRPHVVERMAAREEIGEDDHREFLGRYSQRDRYDFVLIDRRADRYVGAFYLTHLESLPQIGKYIGDTEYLGRGIAYTAMQRLLDYGRSKAGLRRVVSMTRTDNTANIALNTKLGFHASGGAAGDFIMMQLEL